MHRGQTSDILWTRHASQSRENFARLFSVIFPGIPIQQMNTKYVYGCSCVGSLSPAACHRHDICGDLYDCPRSCAVVSSLSQGQV
ncbi:uncharacterized protein si:ch211-198p11.6 isoform X2 [Chanodichthys erythropterus]|uniref:uncharacterized protein si:ch211-198p11.6 isoform X2 n=1 Tax=Chanodichthys erythropterus TaxID=933992 RepID=UPI00351E95BB